MITTSPGKTAPFVTSLTTEMALHELFGATPLSLSDRMLARAQQSILQDQTLFVSPQKQIFSGVKPLRNVAIFGGSFNPPHHGHRGIALTTLQLDRFDEVWMFPAFSHAFGKKLVSFEDRIQLSALLFVHLNEPRLRICRIEEKLGKSPCYTNDTVRALKELFPEIDFTFVAGSDIEKEIDDWDYIDELREVAHILFLKRDESGLSSTLVRNALKNGEDVSRYMPEEELEFIEAHQLYR